ncbi:MAG: anhydro-N-acetylmuramic acid kinase [Salinivirgaceae bacterium]|jgi:anhydro-N-acetylmuramic acid kinase|nr:anhydro-N-acetylmuramic acid kinase [Salinivirgaceae bacterium]
MNILGIMSGTSLDGVDLALCHFETTKGKLQWNILQAATLPYTEDWQYRLQTAHLQSGYDLTLLDVEYGKLLGDIVCDFIAKNNLEKSDIHAVASHGHTVFHQPGLGITLQIGSGAHFAARTGLNVINDFRIQDVAQGGQGAPLVPIGDQLLFSAYSHCLNLGGIANVSYEKGGVRTAGDICPANMVLNQLARLQGLNYDEDGRLAQSGIVNDELLKQLNELPFYRLAFPKSLGREWVEQNIQALLEQSELSVVDQLATFVEHIGQQVGKAIENGDSGQLLITGGGALNTFLVDRIQHYTQHQVVLPEREVIDYKEALIFALLAYLKYAGEINVFASVTGSGRDHIAGVEFKIS